jgi:hypothetical protein
MWSDVHYFLYKIQHSLQILDLTEHPEPIYLCNLSANVGHSVSLRNVNIFFIIRRGKEEGKGGDKQFLGPFGGLTSKPSLSLLLSYLERSKVARELTPKHF